MRTDVSIFVLFSSWPAIKDAEALGENPVIKESVEKKKKVRMHEE
jgi:hypothetical protein